MENFGICSYEFPRCFTADFQKIIYGIIDVNEKELFPFISDTPIHLFNPQNGRAKIAYNAWEHLDKEIEDLCFVTEKTGQRVPLLAHHIEGNWQEINFHKMCKELVFGV